ncbi:UNVERIFIED_CONTAM: hypothetical protein K2H54_051970 [Gekko kuhli]
MSLQQVKFGGLRPEKGVRGGTRQSMPAKKTRKEGGLARKAPRWVPLAISSSEDEGGSSLQDLGAKIEALDQAKVEKQKYVEVPEPQLASGKGELSMPD